MPRVAGWCRPSSSATPRACAQAAGVLGMDPDIVTIDNVSRSRVHARAGSTSSTSACCPTTCPGVSCPLSPATPPTNTSASPASWRWQGEVQAICTAPLNKEALHAAGHIFPGHTELLAHLTGTEEVSMMLSTPEAQGHPRDHAHRPDRRRRQDRARPGGAHHPPRPRGPRQRAGNRQPEDRRLRHQPARRRERTVRLRRRGARRSCPASNGCRPTASTCTDRCPPTPRSSWPAAATTTSIVAMYHDQGHGPVKVLGLEAGVNITVGPAGHPHLRRSRHRLRHRR